MTSVHIDLRNPDLSAPAKMTVVFTPTRRLAAGDFEIVDQPERVVLVDGIGEVDLIATDDATFGPEPWAWKCAEYRPNADGVYTYRLVPTSGAVLEYTALEIVDPAAYQAEETPDPRWWMRIEGLEQAVNVLDADTMHLEGNADDAGTVFWGTWTAGNAPTPPADGKIHWGFELGA